MLVLLLVASESEPVQVLEKPVEPEVGTGAVSGLESATISLHSFRRTPNRRCSRDRKSGRQVPRPRLREPCRLGLPGFELLDRLCEDHIHNDRKTSPQEVLVYCSLDRSRST